MWNFSFFIYVEDIKPKFSSMKLIPTTSGEIARTSLQVSKKKWSRSLMTSLLMKASAQKRKKNCGVNKIGIICGETNRWKKRDLDRLEHEEEVPEVMVYMGRFPTKCRRAKWIMIISRVMLITPSSERMLPLTGWDCQMDGWPTWPKCNQLQWWLSAESVHLMSTAPNAIFWRLRNTYVCYFTFSLA